MHIRQTATGYRVIVQVGGLKRSATTTTKAQARRRGAELEIEMGAAPTRSNNTVAELMDIWLEQTAGHHRATYHVDVARVIRRIPTSFAEKAVADIEPLLVGMLYRKLATAGWSTHRIHRLHQALRAAWRQVAVPYGWANNNPIALITPPTRPATDVHAPTRDQVRAVLALASGTVGLFLEMAARTGARRGELCGLQWADVLDAQIVIRRSIATIPGRPLVIGDTKTGAKGQRVLAIDPQTARALTEHHTRQVELANASRLPEPVWVFSDTAGTTPWRTDYISREFAKLCRQAGVQGIHLHSLRHFVATQLLAAGEPAVTVAHRLGHSTTATTLKTYSHWVQATDQRASDTLQHILDNG